ncbi:MAG: four helix bundle protein [Ignavibacteriae bacterium]|nr:four helix bundle protein [Ignavibacteriota bacterium]
MQGYKKLQIYQMAHQLAVRVHTMSLSLPSFERYEEGSQVRRSSKSVSSNIVEGHALRKYKNEFLHYLFRAYGSCEETIEHLELLFDTKSLKDEQVFKGLHLEYNNLCGKILRFIQIVEKEFDTPQFLKEPLVEYYVSASENHVEQNSKHETQNTSSHTFNS